MAEPTPNPTPQGGAEPPVPTPNGGIEPPAPTPQGAEPFTPKSEEKTEKHFTQADIDKAVADAEEKWKDDQNEAKRLSKMTTEEREKEQFKKERAALDKEKAEFARQQLITETKNQLMERKLPASFAANLCGKDAEETKANIDAFEKDFNAAIEAAVTDRMKGTTPKFGGGNDETDPFLSGLGM